MGKFRIAALGAILMTISSLASAAKAPDTWDGLLKVDSRKADLVYLQPEADFRGYTKVMLDPVEVSFRKNWQRDQNTSSISGRISDEDARKILDAARTGFDKLFHEAYVKAGYQVVAAPGSDVLRVATAVTNLDIEAPDTDYPGISRTYSREAGEATLAIEARDSLSGSLLGRAIDRRDTGDFGPFVRNRTTNFWEFEGLFRKWAQLSAAGLAELKQLSPINADGLRK